MTAWAVPRQAPFVSWVAGRYELGAELGRGAFSVVYAATDRLTGEVVALKRFDEVSVEARVQLGRESAALRAARVRGIVEILDSGIDQGRAFLVMRRVNGSPFPGHVREPSDVVRLAVSVLDVLDRVHALSILHRDIKPQNVLVGAEGEVTLLDFGLAVGAAVGLPLADLSFSGTLRYAAPEQLRGESLDDSSDVFAVGVMILEQLVDEQVLCRALGTLAVGRAVDWSAVRSRGSPDLVHVLSGMLAPDRRARPATAAVAAELLRASLPRVAGPSTSGPRDIAERLFARHASLALGRPIEDASRLEVLFAGPSRILHLPADAAALLMAESDGDPAAARRVVARWLDSGWARVEGERLVVTRAALDHEQLVATRIAMAAARSGAGHADLERLIAETMAALSDARARGLIPLVLPTVLDVLGCARIASDTARESQLLVELVRATVLTGTTRIHEVVLYELGRASDRDDRVLALESLVRAAHLASLGEGARALAELDGQDVAGRTGLGFEAFCVRMSAAHRARDADEVALLAELVERHTHERDPARHAHYTWLLARRAYRAQRFDEAAALHVQEAEASAGLACARAWTFAGSAYLEAFELERAEDCGRRALGILGDARAAVLEARAERILREVARRARRGLEVDHELVAATDQLDDVPLRALILLNEAAVARDLAQPDLARDLAERSYALWRLAESMEGRGLTAALILSLTEDAAAPPDVVADALAVVRAGTPVIALQALALMPRSHRPSGVASRLVAEAMARVPAAKRTVPVDVLSVEEAARRLG